MKRIGTFSKLADTSTSGILQGSRSKKRL